MIPLAMMLYCTIAAAVAAATVIGSCCLKQKKTEATRRSGSLKHFPDDLEVSTNKTQESPRHDRIAPPAHVQLTSIKTARARPESRRVKDIAQRREGRRTRVEDPPSRCRNRRVAVANPQRSNISLTGKRGPNSQTPSSGKGAPSYTAKASRRRGPPLTSDSRPRRRSLLERASNMAKRTRDKKKSDKKAKETQRRKMLDLTDSDEESEDSEALRYRMTFPADPYNQRVPSYTAPDGRVLTPKVEPLAGKEEQIAIRREFRKAAEYPTMEDVKSMWDTIEENEDGGGGGGRGRGRRRSGGTSSSKKKGPAPRSSETPTDTQKTSDQEPRGALQPIAAGGGVTAAAAAGAGGLSNRPSKTDVEDC